MKLSKKLTAFLFASNVAKVLMVLGPLFFVVMTCDTRASAAEFLTPRNLSLDLGAFTSQAAREPYLNTPASGALYSKLDLNWDVDLACTSGSELCLFWDNTIHSLTGQSRFRYVSWEFRTGLDLGRVELFYYHHSEHALDEIPVDRKFPVADAYMVRINFLREVK
jgi:hypothetical protein